ncbi:MAG: phenylalanine--tRNA ligase subunit beta [Gemmatimonadetes bacterium]|nr:phenylalanine--tRNA ligase subunit beta [Gemmatimonadota bacterium]
MNASYDWLSAFVAHGRTPEQLGELIGRHVATLDGIERLRADLVPFVVGRVVETEKIPETKLSFNKVDDGSGTLLEVVCGAPNVTAGKVYPFARTGTLMPAGITIEKRKIRGFTSNGMLCSARELGLGTEHDGILELDTDAAPGTPLLDVLPIGDVRLEIDVLANRPDLLSHRGMAREVAVLTGAPLRTPAELGAPLAGAATVVGAAHATSGAVQVRVDDLDGCPAYMAVAIRGVTVGPSPDWLARRVESVVGRSINNVVDATNYLLHGYGQPMHAFDLGTLAQQTIIVRKAKPGEAIVTLDGVTRTLTPSMTVIADGARAVAVAGVMGGRDSEVTAATTDILLEVAYFAPRGVRATRRALGLNTDASYRYERGTDPRALEETLRIAASLIVAVAGGRVDGAPIHVGRAADAFAAPAVPLSRARLRTVLGTDVPPADVQRRLGSIGFSVRGTDDGWQATPPSWRVDVSRDVDLIEDVARLIGYDALPDELRPQRPGTVPDHPLHVTAQRVRDALVGAGLLEARPSPFVKGSDETHVRVANPLADDEPHLRTSLLETLARRAEYNLTRKQRAVRLFEIGSAFAKASGVLPKEEVRVGVLLMGARRPVHFTEPAPPDVDAWDAKAVGELVAAAGFPGARVKLEAADTGEPDGVLWRIVVEGTPRGVVRTVALDAPVWAASAFGVELTLGVLPSAFVADKGTHAHAEERTPPKRHFVQYAPLPVMEAAQFDLALLVADEMPAAEVERVIRRNSGDLLESLLLFDEFRGTGVPAGKRSLAWRLTFRHPERTLRDKEIDGRRSQLLKTLEKELGVIPRST